MAQIKTILFPTDCSERSQNVFKYALEVARKFHADITMLHVIGDITLYAGASDYLSPINYEHLLNDFENYSQKHLDEFWKSVEVPDVKVTKVQVVGDPFKEIVQYAKDHKMDIIVLSTHGRTGLQHIMLGSVAEKVVRYSPIPVMTVRDKTQKYKPL